MSNNDMVTPKIGTLHYNWHFEMLTPINLGSHFFMFGGDCQRIAWFIELSCCCFYSNSKMNSMMMVPPCILLVTTRGGGGMADGCIILLCTTHDYLHGLNMLNSVNDQALITSCGIDFESFLTLLT